MGDESSKPASTPTGAVFLSYASQDAAEAKRICDALRTAGIEVWFDQSELRGGDAWDRRIREQIHECRLFMPVVSASTEARVEGYFRREWKLAVDRTHDLSERVAFLVPVVIDSTPEQKADVPDAFRKIQWTRLPGGEATGAFATRIAGLVGPEAPRSRSATSPSAPPSPSRHQESQWRPLWVLSLLAALIFAAGGGWLLWRHTGTRPVVTSPPVTEKSIAVLPFVDMSEKHDQSQEYFADGMAAEILTLLGKLPGVHVVGLRSSSQFKTRTDDLRTIGEKLGVAYVIDGSIRRSGDQVRVTAQLIDTRDGIQRWSDVYDRNLSDVISVQNQIASSVAKVLQVAVGEELGSRVTVRNPAAYDLYLRGVHALDKQSRPDCEEAAADFQRALDIDPEFAEASAGLATAYWIMGDQVWLPARDAFERARQAAEQAIRLNPKLGVAHAALAEVHLIYDWDWVRAETEANLALSPGRASKAQRRRRGLRRPSGDGIVLVSSLNLASRSIPWTQCYVCNSRM